MIIEDTTEDGSQLSDIMEIVRNDKRFVYCTVDVPSDLYDGETNEEELRCDYAIYVAHEQLPDYAMPCNWTTLDLGGEKVRVCRESAVVK